MKEKGSVPGLQELSAQAESRGMVVINKTTVGSAVATKLFDGVETPMLKTFRGLPEPTQGELMDKTLEVVIYKGGDVGERRQPNISTNYKPNPVIR